MPTPIDPFDVCCEAMKEQDIPSVQAVILLLSPILDQVWSDMLDNVAEDVSEAQRDELSPEWILFLTELAWRALGRHPSTRTMDTLRSAARRLGADQRASTAVEDLLLFLRGRVHMNNEAFTRLISQRLPRPALRDGLEGIFGREWLRSVLDTWAYRWHWLGSALLNRRVGTKAFRYWNPLDRATTPFCRWLVKSGRVVTSAKIMIQINDLERAVTENNIELSMKAMPLLSFTGLETEKDFNRISLQNNLGAPPFHWGCRTQLLPI